MNKALAETEALLKNILFNRFVVHHRAIPWVYPGEQIDKTQDDINF